MRPWRRRSGRATARPLARDNTECRRACTAPRPTSSDRAPPIEGKGNGSCSADGRAGCVRLLRQLLLQQYAARDAHVVKRPASGPDARRSWSRRGSIAAPAGLSISDVWRSRRRAPPLRALPAWRGPCNERLAGCEGPICTSRADRVASRCNTGLRHMSPAAASCISECAGCRTKVGNFGNLATTNHLEQHVRALQIPVPNLRAATFTIGSGPSALPLTPSAAGAELPCSAAGAVVMRAKCMRVAR